MTASPERTDGYDIFKLFNHTIAYEIRLNQALEEDLLCTFHYFGISDITVNGNNISDMSSEENFSNLTSDNRVKHIIEEAEFYGYSGDRVKGLIFCRTNEEAIVLSHKLNQSGYNTIALSGSNSQVEREGAIERLTNDELSDKLDYILTVDIFNEGIDIPDVNQVIMLRPTESPIVFVQQLGRGLRKHRDKEYVIVLDFIANYKNNFLIPIALSGDRTYNKDVVRKYVMEGTKVIPGSSTIHFDEVSKQEIYNSINSMKTNLSLLKDKYQNLKYRLGRIPTLMDFYHQGEIDPLLILNYSGNYHMFLKRVEKEYGAELSREDLVYLDFFSSFIANGKRIHESLIIEQLIRYEITNLDEINNLLEKKYGIKNDGESVSSGLKLLAGHFINSSGDKKKYKSVDILSNNPNKISISPKFKSLLDNETFNQNIMDIVEISENKYLNEYHDNADHSNLSLYKKYSRKDVCRMLNWEKDDSSTIYGYRIKYNTCPIFVTYDKKDEISSSTQYDDRFISNSVFNWMTRNRVTEQSNEAQSIINHDTNGLEIYLFIKKSDDEGSDFYYLGPVMPKDWHQTIIQDDKGKVLPIMNFQFELEHPVRDDIYDYFTQ